MNANKLEFSLKNITMGEMKIFKEEEKSTLLTMGASFESDGRDVTQQIFKQLTLFSVNKENKQQKENPWLDVHKTLCIQYNQSDKQIYFKEKENNSLSNLPSFLCRDWKIIDGEEMELLATFISTNPLVEESQNTFRLK